MKVYDLFAPIEMWFSLHPQSVCMSYMEHLRFSGMLAGRMCIGGIKALIHAIFPQMYITSSTELIRDLDQKLTEAGCK